MLDVQAVYGSPIKTDRKPQNSDSALGMDNMDQFLNLMVTQLKYQDPLNPSDGADYLAQTAQMTTVEQLINLNRNTKQTYAASFLGKEITANVTNSGGGTEEVKGLVKEIQYPEEGDPILVLTDGSVVHLKEVVNVTEPA